MWSGTQISWYSQSRFLERTRQLARVINNGWSSTTSRLMYDLELLATWQILDHTSRNLGHGPWHFGPGHECTPTERRSERDTRLDERIERLAYLRQPRLHKRTNTTLDKTKPNLSQSTKPHAGHQPSPFCPKRRPNQPAHPIKHWIKLWHANFLIFAK